MTSVRANTYSARETGRLRSWQPGTQSRVDLQGHGSPGGRVQATQIANQRFLGCLCMMVMPCHATVHLGMTYIRGPGHLGVLP
jgi:hypothetical protein